MSQKINAKALQIGCAVIAVAGIVAFAALFILAHFILKYW